MGNRVKPSSNSCRPHCSSPICCKNTREGFFSDPIHGGNKGMVGWTLINFPGARADFMDWVERGERYPFPPVSINGERA
ncbi:gluconate 2-dehydrogenase subunit gamma [Klebsiella pneumoniae]|nr:gluconate 2-dehydrogenase subunit gamma [Klebsiella pneumoniae]